LLENPKDYDARAELAWSATMALNGMTAVGRGRGDWASHQIEHAMSAIYDIAHGAGLAIILPAWLEYTKDVNGDKIIQLGERVFGMKGSEDELIAKIRETYRKWGAPVYLQDAGIPLDDIEKIASNPSIRYPTGYAKRLQKEDVMEILRIAGKG
jgi:alcohol dehydrogenase YqhD (iron-dependent ADH family)